MPQRPRVVVHASISVDGSITGFEPDLAAHYAAAAGIPAGARLIGSVTMATGLDRFGEPADSAVPTAGSAPRRRPDEPTLPYWVVVDSTGRLHGRLQPVRDFPPVRDVLVLVSHATPDSYLQYLADHGYRWIMTGNSRVDLPAALERLHASYGVERVLVDSGPALLSALLEVRVVDELSLLVHPVVVGRASTPLFSSARTGAALQLLTSSTEDAGRVLLRYRVAATP